MIARKFDGLAKEKCGLPNAVINWEDRLFRWFPTLILDPDPMTQIRFDSRITVTIRDGWLAAPTPELTAILDTLAGALPGYGSIPFMLDEDFNIAQGLVRMVGVGKVVRRDKLLPLQTRRLGWRPERNPRAVESSKK
jgi:hypothetical protein